MKKKLSLLVLLICVSFNGRSQSISFTTVPTTAATGTVLTVNYKYTATANTNIYCNLELLDDWTWVSEVGHSGLNPAVAGTDVTGSFNITIPNGTTPSANLTGNLNYKIKMEMQSLPDYKWLAGVYQPVIITQGQLGLDDNTLANKITVYPNPVTDVLKIGTTDNLDNASFSVVDVLGQTVLKTKKAVNNSIDVSNLSSGVYVLSLNSGDKTQQFKFYKK